MERGDNMPNYGDPSVRAIWKKVTDYVDGVANKLLIQRLTRERHQIITAGDVSVSGGDYLEGTYTVTKDGYRPFGIVGHTFSGTNRTWMGEGCKSRIANVQDGSCDIDIVIRNHGTNAWSGGLYVDVLWVKL